MLHPSAIFRDWRQLFSSRADAKKLKQYLNNPHFDIPVKRLELYGKTVCRSLRTRTELDGPRTAEEFITRLEAMHKAEYLSFDIETYEGTVTVMGFADSTGHAISIPFTGQFTIAEEAALAKACGALLDTPVPKVAQNGIYDCSYLASVWQMPVRGMVWDTMLMHHCLYSEQPHSLAFLASIYCHEPFFKMMAKESSNADYQQAHWEYNALDVICTLEAFHQLKSELQHYGLTDFYLSTYAPLSKTLARIQSRGLLLNKDARNKIRTKLSSEVDQIQARINEIAETDINPNSPKQMKEYVYGVLRLPEQRKRGTRTITTDDKALSSLRRKYPRHEEFISLCLDARGKRKSIGTFLKDFEDPDGRVRTSYNIAGNSRKADASGGAETGRLSSSTNIYGRGTNLQNQPKWARELYVPDPGWTFWQADLSSAESYIVAWDSGDEGMFKILTNHSIFGEGRPDKILYHEFIGSIILGVEPKEIVGDLRQLAKTVGHGYNYSMGAKTLAENVNNRQPHLRFTQATARDCFRALDNNLQGLVSWRHRIKSSIRQTRRLKNCFGRQRIFFGRLEDNTYREAYAFLPQSSIGDAVNLSLIELEGRFTGRSDIQILGQVHDSVFGQCSPDALPYVEQNVVEVLQRELPMNVYGVPLRIPCEFKSGKNWKETS
tara:strand:- start:245 stop:2233 length:1989 start_codon:yes stop_codon:yes gene_type:complete